MISRQLLLFVTEEIGKHRMLPLLSGNTRIEDDLGIYGDDADEFIERFAREFSVDISGFMIAEYFSPEGELNVMPFVRRLFGKENKKRKVLTLQYLQDAIYNKKLV